MDEPTWICDAIKRLEALDYIVTVRYDADGDNWDNKLYTVKKGGVTYAQDVRALYLLRIA